MAAPSIAVSQTFSVVASEVHFSSNDFFSTIVVENATSSAVNVACDGGTAVAGATTHGMTVPPGAICGFGNLLPLPNANVPATDYSLNEGWDAQDGWQGTALTTCSIIPQASTSGEVTISFQ